MADERNNNTFEPQTPIEMEQAFVYVEAQPGVQNPLETAQPLAYNGAPHSAQTPPEAEQPFAYIEAPHSAQTPHDAAQTFASAEAASFARLPPELAQYFEAPRGTEAPPAAAQSPGYTTAWQQTRQNPNYVYGTAAMPQPSTEQARQADTPPTTPETRKPRRAGRALAGIAMVLVCALAGFGGGYAAVLTQDTPTASNGSTVVFHAAQDNNSAETPAVNTDTQTSSLRDAAEKASASSVSISVEIAGAGIMGTSGTGAGSGVILSEDGYIITNHHVIEDATSILVTLPNGEEYEASLVASDEKSDIAVIKIEASGLTPAVVADSDDLQLGETVIAVGNSTGVLGGTVTDGIISALDRELSIEGKTMNLLQTSAAISPGNSGGGLFNQRGELIGIINAKSGVSNAEGLGFAIPINDAISVATDLIQSGYVTGRPGMGVSVMQVSTQREAAWLGVTEGGVYIQAVNKGGAAEQAGVEAGDRIISIDGEDVDSLETLSSLLDEKQVGDEITLEVQRGTQTLSLRLELQELVPTAAVDKG